jgi:Ca-activated chloride channel homolog
MRTTHDAKVVRHRKPGGRGRRSARFAGLAVVLAALLATGYTVFPMLGAGKQGGCDVQDPMVTVTAAPAVAGALQQAATQWMATGPRVEGRCVGARVESSESAEFVASLGRDRAVAHGAGPRVWVPESTLWLLIAQAQLGTSNIISAVSPSIGSSPLVLAARRTLLEGIGWPQRQLSWEDLLGALADPRALAAAGPAALGPQIALGDPTSSFAGLAALLMMLDQDGDGAFSDAELASGVALSQALGSVVPRTDDILDAGPGADATVGVVPVLERDLLTRPGAPFAAIYPRGASFVADFPFAVLDERSLDSRDAATIAMFLEHLRGAQGREALAAAGMRDVNGGPPKAFAAAPAQLAPGRPAPQPAALNAMLSDWFNIQRPVNALAVLDTSGSMNLTVPGSSQTRIGLLQQTAVSGFSLLPPGTKMGLWHFDSVRHVAVPFGPIDEVIGGHSRSQLLIGAASALRAQGDTALFDTVLAAYAEMSRHWEPNHNNVVFITTDGKNDLPGGLSEAEFISRLAQLVDPKRPIAVVSIAVGPDADAATLAEISRVTGGRAFVERDPAHAVRTLVLAFAGRLR